MINLHAQYSFMEVKIYKAKVVQELQAFYADIIQSRESYNSIKDHLSAFALKMYEGVNSNNKSQFTELNNYHPKYIGKTVDELIDVSISKEDCFECVAYQRGFKNWNECSTLTNIPYNHSFELAVELLLNGQIDLLKDQLKKEPELIAYKSQFGHQATLLLYSASNGVELYRQQVPSNLEQIIEILLNTGADLNSKMKVYGGEFDTFSLFTTSAHPYKAGIGKRIENMLKRKMST